MKQEQNKYSYKYEEALVSLKFARKQMQQNLPKTLQRGFNPTHQENLSNAHEGY